MERSVCSPWRRPCYSRGEIPKEAVTLRKICAEVIFWLKNCCHQKTPTLEEVHGRVSPVWGTMFPQGRTIRNVSLGEERAAEAIWSKLGLTAISVLCHTAWQGGSSKAVPGKKVEVGGKMYLRSWFYFFLPVLLQFNMWLSRDFVV